MSGRGRHARSNGPGFYRDALLLVGGILIVGALVFGGLSLWAGGRGEEPTTSTTSTATTAEREPVTTSTSVPSTVMAATTSTVPSDPTTSTVTTVTSTTLAAPSETGVVVLNSIGVTGLAGELSQELADLGYQMAEADNYTPELSDTMIFHDEGFAAEAQALVETVPDATVAPDPELATTWGVDIVVVIGQSYQE